MPYPKPADQATSKWMLPLPFYGLGQRKYMCTRIFQTKNSNKPLLKATESKENSYGFNYLST